jgi:hypothetical protein
MAKRKNKLLLSDLFPELAGTTEREEEEEKEEPARKVRKVDAAGRDRSKQAAQWEEKWNGRLEVAKQWKRTKGRFVSEEQQEGQGGAEFVQLADGTCAWRKVLDPGAVGEAERGVR